ncbi:hypothetical protein V2A60_004040 [Cordyceps javanica]
MAALSRLKLLTGAEAAKPASCSQMQHKPDYGNQRAAETEKLLLYLSGSILRKRHLYMRLLLVDDVTSDLGDEIADCIQDVIEAMFADCTIVMATGRMEAPHSMQKIVRISQEKIINMIDRPRVRHQRLGGSDSDIFC